MLAGKAVRQVAAALVVAFGGLAGCSPGEGGGGGGRQQEETYTSPVVQGEAAAINLEAVEKAFLESKGTDFASWMGAFERRVNEVYEGDGVVSVDARRKDDRLVVQGFVDTNGQEGMQPADRRLFSLEQTGPATRDAVPMKVADGQGAVYNQGDFGLMGSPFLSMFLTMAMFSWAGSYFTPRTQILALSDHRQAYRRTPAYRQQVLANRDFRTRFQARAGGGVRSNQRFGDRRTTVRQTPRQGQWGGRRAPAGGGARRTWGGRRR